MKRTAILLAVLLCIPLVSRAHMNSMSFSTIKVEDGVIHWEMRFTLLCTLELFAVDIDNDNFLSKEEIRSAWPMMYYYLSNKLKVMAGGRQLRMTLRDITFKVEEDDSYTVFDMEFKLPKKQSNPDQILFVCNVLEETDPYHRNLADIDLGKDAYVFVFNNINYFDTAHIPAHVQKIVEDDNADAIFSATDTIDAGTGTIRIEPQEN